jgi:hypothetical protein
MPATTGTGITYPISTDTVHLTDDLATMANSIDGIVAADHALRDGNWVLYPAVITGATSGTWTSGTATVSTYYTRIGKSVLVNGNIIFGSTTSVAAVSGSMQVSLPITARNSVPADIGAGMIFDASPVVRSGISCQLSGTGNFQMVVQSTGVIVLNTAPWTWAQNDEIRFHLFYEANSLP